VIWLDSVRLAGDMAGQCEAIAGDMAGQCEASW